MFCFAAKKAGSASAASIRQIAERVPDIDVHAEFFIQELLSSRVFQVWRGDFFGSFWTSAWRILASLWVQGMWTVSVPLALALVLPLPLVVALLLCVRHLSTLWVRDFIDLQLRTVQRARRTVLDVMHHQSVWSYTCREPCLHWPRFWECA